MNIETTIRNKLQESLKPVELEVINESHMHSVPANSETHFKVIVVSDSFDGETLIKRHRKVNGLLADELAAGVHALGFHSMTPAEWKAKRETVAASPKCLGGSKS